MNEWISVKDRRPEEKDQNMILAYHAVYKKFAALQYQCGWSGDFAWLEMVNEEYSWSDFTHWMPLPEPPK